MSLETDAKDEDQDSAEGNKTSICKSHAEVESGAESRTSNTKKNKRRKARCKRKTATRQSLAELESEAMNLDSDAKS